MKLRYSEQTAGIYRDGALVGTIVPDRDGSVWYRHFQFDGLAYCHAQTVEELLPKIRQLLETAVAPTRII